MLSIASNNLREKNNNNFTFNSTYDDQISTLKESGIYAEKLHSNQSYDDLNASW